MRARPADRWSATVWRGAPELVYFFQLSPLANSTYPAPQTTAVCHLIGKAFIHGPGTRRSRALTARSDPDDFPKPTGVTTLIGKAGEDRSKPSYFRFSIFPLVKCRRRAIGARTIRMSCAASDVRLWHLAEIALLLTQSGRCSRLNCDELIDVSYPRCQLRQRGPSTPCLICLITASISVRSQTSANLPSSTR